MRDLFVFEYIAGGGCPQPAESPSLLREGRAMLCAVLEDFARIEDCRVFTTCAQSIVLPPVPLGLPPVSITPVHLFNRWTVFRSLAKACNATFVIAPEFGGILERYRRTVDEVGGTFIGSTPFAIKLCSDKLLLSRFFKRFGIPRIKTTNLRGIDPPWPFPVVVKPRDGAGSLDVRLVRDQREWTEVDAFWSDQFDREAICQQFIPGEALSTAVIVPPHRPVSMHDVFPIARQRLSTDGRFGYQGGCIPAMNSPDPRIAELVARAASTIPGLAGYVGFDLIMREDNHEPVIVEVNPRLTTSYLGYRELTEENLAQRMLAPEDFLNPVLWKNQPVRFTADGRIISQSARG